MLLKKLFVPDKKERVVIENLAKHIKLLCSALGVFEKAIKGQNKQLMRGIIDLEREGDVIRREIVSTIYEGAFLPYLRPGLCKFAEIVDKVFDLLEDAAYQYLDLKVYESIQGNCSQISTLNLGMGEMLLISFEALMSGGDLREKALAIRAYEKKIDDIKFDLFEELKKIDVKTFWEGKALSDFFSSLTSVSDVIEDASDYLQVIKAGLV